MDVETETETTETTTPVVGHIYQALCAVMGELAKIGIAKDRRNEQQGFRFRGIDDVMNAVSPILAKHGVVFLPDYEDFPNVERVTKGGSSMIQAKVRGTYTFISAKDGSEVCVSSLGEAMDSGDKACNKAMSNALKYALLQTFLIPTESSEDADATTPEETVPKPPAGFDEWWVELVPVKEKGFEPLLAKWRKSSQVFRDYAMKYRETEWKKTKERGIAVTEQQKKARLEAEEKAKLEAAKPVAAP